MPDAPTPDPRPSTDLAPRPDKTPVAFGVVPGTLDEAWRWSNAAKDSTLLPKAYQGRPADILVALQLGVEVGFGPATAVQNIVVINGRPALFGDGLLAVVMSSPLYAGHDEYFEVSTDGATFCRAFTLTSADLKSEHTRAVCAFRRKGHADPFVRAFSIADAKRANLFDKDGPWKTYPGRMLGWRALGFAARAAFPDALKGLRSVEELADIPPDEAPTTRPVVQRRSTAPVVDVPAEEPVPAHVTVRGIVKAIDPQSYGTACVVLASGEELCLPAESDDAIGELRKSLARGDVLRFTCRQDRAGLLHIADFRIAD